MNSRITLSPSPSLSLADPPPIMSRRERFSGGVALKRSRENTPIAAETPQPKGAKQAVKKEDNTVLATMFKSDLTSIRGLVTCSICDQLLYEPWTLGCGHTYCYSCLCNWFVPNRRKKTCPECRTRVKQMPAPSFLVKQLVEVFVKRDELMPSDESIEQHTQRRADEVADVDKDRNSPTGLFKGIFKSPGADLWRDDEDGGVMRCRYCGHEHVGGPRCQACGADFDEDDFSDFDEDDIYDRDGEVEGELDGEFAAMQGRPHFIDVPHFADPIYRFHGVHHHHHYDNHDDDDEDEDSSDVQPLSSNSSDRSSEEDDEAGSLDEFIAPEDEEPVPVITISDDESDEGGAVSNRIPRRRARVVNLASSSPSPSIFIEDSEANASEAGEVHDEVERLRNAGWSPLDQGNESDVDDQFQFHAGFEYGSGRDEQESEDDSDTETMVGQGISDEDDGRDREETPRVYPHTYPPYIPHEHIPGNYPSSLEDAEDMESTGGYSTAYDQDGDTEMSLSPRVASRSVDYENNDYPDEMSSGRGRSCSTDEVGPSPYEYDLRELGPTNEILEIDDDSEDSAPRPPQRRLPRRHHPSAQNQEYDPRISMIFAEHQQSMGGFRNQPLEELDNEVRRVEPGSRSRRRLYTYRNEPPRRTDVLRSSRLPSATRVVASSSRNPRANRHYVGRN